MAFTQVYSILAARREGLWVGGGWSEGVRALYSVPYLPRGIRIQLGPPVAPEWPRLLEWGHCQSFSQLLARDEVASSAGELNLIIKALTESPHWNMITGGGG